MNRDKAIRGLILAPAIPLRNADAKRWNEKVGAWPK